MLAPGESRRRFLARLRWLAAPVLYAVGFLGAAFLILGHFSSWYAAGPLTVAAEVVANVDDPAYVRRHFRAYSEKGWDGYLTVVDTLPSGLVLFEVD